MTGIYKWTSPSGKAYIGKAINLERRKKEFLTNPQKYIYTSKDSAVDRARRKYNVNDWKYEILATIHGTDTNILTDKLNALEKHYIQLYDTTNSRNGYNSTKGGDGAATTCKPINQYDLNGKFIKSWNSIAEAARFYSCDSSTIMRNCKGRQKTAIGYKWEYRM